MKDQAQTTPLPEMDSPWMQTLSGAKWDLITPDKDKVNWRDIAHSLGMLCRFNGHVRQFYSVAEHSCHVHDLVSDLNDPILSLTALIHDAHEAFVGDITTPLAMALGDFDGIALDAIREIKDKHDAILFEAAGLTGGAESVRSADQIKKMVKKADLIMLATERKALLVKSPAPWGTFDAIEPSTDVKIECWTPSRAASEFGARWVHAHIAVMDMNEGAS
jgi:hypothetical protein